MFHAAILVVVVRGENLLEYSNKVFLPYFYSTYTPMTIRQRSNWGIPGKGMLTLAPVGLFREGNRLRFICTVANKSLTVTVVISPPSAAPNFRELPRSVNREFLEA